MSTFLQDLRYGIRMALRSPGFTLVAVLTLAIGIAVNTTVFSWVDMMLLQPIPGAANPGELAVFETVAPDGTALPTSFPDFRDHRDHLKLLSGLAAATPATMTMGEGEHAGRVWAELVSANYFAVLGVKPVRGRMFSQEECGDKRDACPVAVIGEGLWKSRFHGDPRVIGTTVLLNRQKLTVIGIAPAEFSGSLPGLTLSIWAPLTMGTRFNMFPEHALDNRGVRYFMGVARLKPGVSLAQARTECSSLARQIAQLNPHANAGIGATLLPIRQGHFGGQTLMAGPLTILMAVCGLVFLIVCANVSSLLLARAIARRREFSVRMAMGAGRARLARQLLSESLILAVLGVLAGVPLAMWMSQSLGYLMPRGANVPVSFDIPLNSEILAFTILLCVAACVLSGIAPALHSARAGLNEALKEGGRSGGEGARSERTRGLLVVSEVAMALVAIIGTGLFARSFQMARQINPGFDPHNVLVARLELASAGYTGLDRTRFFERLRDRLSSQPGIVSVSWADVVPLYFTGNPWDDVQVEGYVPGVKESMKIMRNMVGPGYLGLMRIPLVEGRDFTGHDDENAPPVMIVNRTFARHFFGGGTAIGHRVRNGDRWFTIAGVARDSKYVRPDEAATPYFYALSRQAYSSPAAAMFIRTTGDPERAAATVRSATNSIDPGVGVFDAMPLTESIGASLFGQKTAAVMLAVLGVVALVLAATGLYSVMAYSVAQRTREIGLRMALGARPADVLALVMRRGLLLTLFGVGIGVVAALAVTRLAASLLVHVSATDPLVFGAATLFLAAVALAANYLPARRATRIDPNEALRCE
ncbi:MAG: ABC transporter permease [Bryobacteraceae bacterium]